MMRRLRPSVPLAALILLGLGLAFGVEGDPPPDLFRQLDELLPTPNEYRTASGAPGVRYWQQRADYEIDVELDDAEQRILGSERIVYTNDSPDVLTYLWLQVDANIYSPASHSVRTALAPELETASYSSLRNLLARPDFDGAARITAVRDERGEPLAHTIVDTMMRVDLPRPLRTGESFRFSVDWNYKINDSDLVRGRTGCEHFEEDGNWIYEIAQWFPRMAAYTDYAGWQHKQFLGSGEFTLEFGDYLVRITVPDDHVVAATGVLQNPEEVLTEAQRSRLLDAEQADAPVFVVTPEEARENEKSPATDKKTWVFRAESVRDFAFASSRKFIWDAKQHVSGDRAVMCMSFYPNEGEPLWSRYSTHAIEHTIEVYSKFTFPYPYPVAISVNGPVGGMEYPMICFNGPRPEKDGTYSSRTKYGLISVIIHEVGHNWFPMIVNSDERQWTWMDEGLNTFLQYLAEQEWEADYPSSSGEPQGIADYMISTGQVPIMTNSDSLLKFGSNAYDKPATALNMLRETVMGRELFDFAFKQYASRWRFKRPAPADFFRSMEDASAVDLDWFWRGWFYTTDHCDLALGNIELFTVDTNDPAVEKARQKAEREAEPVTLSEERNRILRKRVERFPELADFYNEYDELDVTAKDVERYEKLVADLKDDEKSMLAVQALLYVVEIENLGGLVGPVVLDVEYEDGTREELRVPAEAWRRSAERIRKLVVADRPIRSVVLDPRLETADADLSNNFWPPRIDETRVKLRKREEGERKNPMQEALEAERAKAGEAEAASSEEPAPATGGDGSGATGSGGR